jgi:hypothetical protein
MSRPGRRPLSETIRNRKKNDVAIQYKRNCGTNYLRNNSSQRVTVTAALVQLAVLHIAALQVSECPHLQQLTKKNDCEG